MFTDSERREFKELGFIVKHDALDEDIVREVREGVEHVMPEDREAYQRLQSQPEKLDERLQEVPSFEPFLELNKQVHEYAEALMGEGQLREPQGGTQLALRYPTGNNSHNPDAEQPRDLHGHIDGYHSGYEFGDNIEYASMFGVAYLDRVRPQGGGFTVWPGSHWNIAEYFSEHSLESGRGGIPGFDEDGEWDYDTKRHEQFDPFEITGDAGTLILAHYKIEHTGGINLSTDVRKAAIQRFRRKNAQEQVRDAAENIWKYWPAMQDVSVSENFDDVEVIEEPIGDSTVDIIEKRGD